MKKLLMKASDLDPIQATVETVRDELDIMMDMMAFLADPEHSGPAPEGMTAEAATLCLEQPMHAAAMAAKQAGEFVNTLASLTLVLRWEKAVKAALEATDEDKKTLDAVKDELDSFGLRNTLATETDAEKHGPYIALFRQRVILETAKASAMCGAMVRGHASAQELCLKHGIDFAKVEAEDPATLMALAKAAASSITPEALREYANSGVATDSPMAKAARELAGELGGVATDAGLTPSGRLDGVGNVSGFQPNVGGSNEDEQAIRA